MALVLCRWAVPLTSTLGFFRMRINGWHRLWIVVVVIWLCIVIAFAWYSRPTPETIPHSEAFLAAVQPRSAMVQCIPPMIQEECAKQAMVVIRMPNGYHFLLAVDDNKDSVSALESYWQAVEDAAIDEQKRAALLAFAVWIIPSIAILLFGYAVAWVRRGFMGTR